MPKKIGIADTMFSRADMFSIAKKAIEDSMETVDIERYTVPGVKDLPIACKRLLEDCDICLALGMPGPMPIDKQCAHEASTGLIQAQLMAGKHILEVFVHLDEADDDRKLLEIVKNRVYDHTKNALALLKGRNSLERFAGKGIRQGHENEGSVD